MQAALMLAAMKREHRAAAACFAVSMLTLSSARAQALPEADPAPESDPASAAARDAGAVASSSEAAAASELELSAFAGPSVVFGAPANPAYSPSVERIGALVAGALTYRSRYFIDPVLEVGYAWLARGSSDLPDGPWGAGGMVEQKLGTWLISPGVSAELWRFRARFGLGLGIVTQSDTFRGQTSSTTQLSVMSQLVVAFKAVDLAAVQLDVEGRGVLASGADLSFIGIGVSARFGVLEFGH